MRNLTNMGDLIAHGRNLADRGLEPLLRVRCAAEPVTGLLPDVCREQEGRELSEVEVVDDAERFCCREPRPQRACEGLTFAFSQRPPNLWRGRFAELRGVNFPNDPA